jgi:hypothetical protein
MLLPPSTNQDYTGSPWSWVFLVFVAIVTIVPGLIHYVLPDGGAGVIAGIDLSANAQIIVAVFAWVGAIQIAYGLVLLAIALWYRPLVGLSLSAELIHRLLSVMADWWLKNTGTGNHPPGQYGSLISLPLLVIFIYLAIRKVPPPSAAS